MSYLECITNTVPDIRPCVIAGEHTAACDGNEHRNATVGKDEKGYPIYGVVETGKQCRSCVPKPAAVGMLCLTCWRRLELTLAEWYLAEDVIATHDILIRRDAAGVRTMRDGYIALPMTTLAVDEVRSYLRGAPRQTQAWVSTVDGAVNAIRFTNAAQNALRTFPIEERQQPLKRMRCPNPVHGSYPPLVQWNPPSAFAEPVTVTCTCGWRQADQDKIDEIAAIEALPA